MRIKGLAPFTIGTVGLAFAMFGSGIFTRAFSAGCVLLVLAVFCF